jgi:hypothetical protein
MIRTKKKDKWKSRKGAGHQRRSALTLEALERREVMAANFLQGVSFHDANSDGQFNPGDTPLSGAIVTLQKLNDASFVPQTRTTGANGSYQFLDLPAGNYRLTETPPTGYLHSASQTNRSQLNRVDASTSNSIDVTVGDPTVPGTWLLSYPSRVKEGSIILHENGNVTPPGFVGQSNINVNETDVGYQTPTFASFCIDINRDIITGESNLPYTVKPFDNATIPASAYPQNANRIAYLYDKYALGAPLTTAQATGLQLAIWELEYERADPLPTSDRLTTGTFFAEIRFIGGGTVQRPSPEALAFAEQVLDDALSSTFAPNVLAMYLDGYPTTTPNRPAGSQGLIASGSLNFGHIQSAAIGNFAWADLDKDGAQDPGEPGIDGVNVTLLAANGSTVATTVTALGGMYNFAGLTPGDYRVRFEFPAVYDLTGSDMAADDVDSDVEPDGDSENIGITGLINLAAGETDNTVDAGAIFPETGGGSALVTVLKHTNGTNNDTPPGPVVAVGSTVTWSYTINATVAMNNVTLRDDNGTAATGDDFILNVGSLPAGGSFTHTRTGIATAGQYTNTAYVTGRDAVFNVEVTDTDVDHYFGAAPGIRLQKLTNGTDNNSGTGPSVPVGSTVTWTYIVTNTGNMALSDIVVVDDGGPNPDFTVGTIASLAPGASTTLTATGIAQAGQYQNTATATGHDSINQSVSASDVDHYFGVAAPAAGKLSGHVYRDLDNDGKKEAGEPGIGGVTVKLSGTDANGNPVNATQTTNVDGFYEFLGLAEGTYKITEVQPDGWLDGKDSVGSEGGTLSDDMVSNIALGAGENGTGYNFGELKGSKLSGYVYLDNDNDGKRETGESGLAGTKITLIGLTDECLAYYTTYTNSQGYYEFTNLRPGLYAIAESQSRFYADGKDTLGTINGQTSGIVLNDIFIVCLTEGDLGLNYNFGERRYPVYYC